MLLEPDVLKTLYGDQIVADNPQIVKQRSQEWHDLRQLSKVTSSTMHNALDFWMLKLQKEHYKRFIKKAKVPSPVTEAMQHGTDNEVRWNFQLTSAKHTWKLNETFLNVEIQSNILK